MPLRARISWQVQTHRFLFGKLTVKRLLLVSCYQIVCCHPSSVVSRVGDTYRYVSDAAVVHPVIQFRLSHQFWYPIPNKGVYRTMWYDSPQSRPRVSSTCFIPCSLSRWSRVSSFFLCYCCHTTKKSNSCADLFLQPWKEHMHPGILSISLAFKVLLSTSVESNWPLVVLGEI